MGKHAAGRRASDDLAGALADCSGDIAAAERYDGPLCGLSLVDNRRVTRLLSDGLDHHPTHADIRSFCRRFRAALDARSRTVLGLTTAAAPRAPAPVAEICGQVPHQIGAFHPIAAITKAVLTAVARVRQALAAPIPTRPRGRPAATAAQHQARAQHTRPQNVTALFDHRDLFVPHALTPAARKPRAQISRGYTPRRALREILDAVYRLLDRRCRTATARQQLAKRRRRVYRFKPVGKTLPQRSSPNLEKALTCLDDPLLPSTSTAVERGNRRHRTMPNIVSRVRTREHISRRIALDRLREAQGEGRTPTTRRLHLARTGS